ncbi:hypothetical protein LOC71_20700 [Rhodopirellula sp. JC740]|uniref:DUF1570 domain-containing protein n=1 Tax=Rhodopirellula halodulae TaxID=2894198 RepID=A0ABS8NMG4_9BACT|nr:hypothetical protein [Rhodopirellula sp. JC740]MCC9644700.1 hypothetical protein [Rhodopirellula sp. JC740]
MSNLLLQIPDAVDVRDGLPRPNWDVIHAWSETNVDSRSLNDTWTRIARDWLKLLADALPHDYTVRESSEFLLLATDVPLGERILAFSEHARRVILEKLDGVASDEGHGKHVILLLGDDDAYYDYVTDFYPDEGEFGLSGGMFLSAGYGHFVICPSSAVEYERVIAHELNHALLSHLPLPLWLNEGVTQVIEDIVVDSSYFMVDHEILQRHRAYWNLQTINSFWSGESFSFPDEGQELSYGLAQVLFRNLMSDFPEVVKDILNNASYVDAGNSAFLQFCNVSIADRAAQFLGNGDWTARGNYADLDGSGTMDGYHRGVA